MDGRRLRAAVDLRKPDPKRSVGHSIAVCVDVDFVNRGAVERVGEQGSQRVDVEYQNRLACIARLEERVYVRDIGLRIPHRRPDGGRVVADRDHYRAWRVKVVSHGQSSITYHWSRVPTRRRKGMSP